MKTTKEIWLTEAFEDLNSNGKNWYSEQELKDIFSKINDRLEWAKCQIDSLSSEDILDQLTDDIDTIKEETFKLVKINK